MEIETYRYRMEHGKRPSGNGSWAFHPNFNVDAASPEIFWFHGTFSEAKKAAKAHFKAKGIVRTIQTLS